MYSHILISHCALMCLIAPILKSTGSSTTSPISLVGWFRICCINCSEYHSENCFFKKLLAGLFTDMSTGCNRSVVFVGSKQTWRLHFSSRVVTFLVTCRLKLSIITTHGLVLWKNVWLQQQHHVYLHKHQSLHAFEGCTCMKEKLCDSRVRMKLLIHFSR